MCKVCYKCSPLPVPSIFKQHHMLVLVRDLLIASNRDPAEIYSIKKMNELTRNRSISTQIIKIIYEKVTANIIINESFSSKLGNKIRMIAFSTFSSIVLEVLARKFRQGKETKGTQIQKEEIK